MGRYRSGSFSNHTYGTFSDPLVRTTILPSLKIDLDDDLPSSAKRMAVLSQYTLDDQADIAQRSRQADYNALKSIDDRLACDYALPLVGRSRSLSPVRETSTTYSMRRARSVSPIREVAARGDISRTEEPYYPYYYRRGYYPYSYRSFYPYVGYSYGYSPSYYRGSRSYLPYYSYYGRPSYYRGSAAALDAEVHDYLNRYPTSSYHYSYPSYYDYDYYPSYRYRYSYSSPRYWWY